MKEVLYKQAETVVRFTVISNKKQTLGNHCATLPKYSNAMPMLMVIPQNGQKYSFRLKGKFTTSGMGREGN
jgi:hypothetical protein